MIKSYQSISTRQTPQTEPVIGENMIQNSDVGYVFSLDKWKTLDRFLILGTESNTYYSTAEKLTVENTTNLDACVKENGKRTVDRIIEVSDRGLSVKNDACLFALAFCAAASDPIVRKYALDNLNKVARISTHLFHFNAFVEQFRGRGRALNTAIRNWYQSKTIEQLAFQVVKYQSRDGWSHRDLLRLCKPLPKSFEESLTYRWVVGKEPVEGTVYQKLIEGFELAKASEKPNLHLIQEYRLTREMVPTSWLNDPNVWDALLPNLGLTAIIRNLAKMTAVGLLKPMSNAASFVREAITDTEQLKRQRIHPISILSALKVYSQGHGERGSLRWSPVPSIIDALDIAFYRAFDSIEKTGKRHLIGVDVSGSMYLPSYNRNFPITGLVSRDVAAALAMVTARTEDNYYIHGFNSSFVDLKITSRSRLDDVIKRVAEVESAATDCAIPMIWALENKIQVDVFQVITDNETNTKSIHPFQSLSEYRNKINPNAKLVVLACTATNFSIAKPGDPNMLDLVGCSTDTPTIIHEFSLGNI